MFNNEGGSLTSPHCLWVTKHPPHRKDWAHCASWLPLTMYAHYDGLFPTVTLCVGWVLKCQLCIWNFTDFFFLQLFEDLSLLFLVKLRKESVGEINYTVQHCFPKCGPQRSSVSITWELVINTDVWVPLQTRPPESEALGVESRNVCVLGPLGGANAENWASPRWCCWHSG